MWDKKKIFSRTRICQCACFVHVLFGCCLMLCIFKYTLCYTYFTFDRGFWLCFIFFICTFGFVAFIFIKNMPKGLKQEQSAKNLNPQKMLQKWMKDCWSRFLGASLFIAFAHLITLESIFSYTHALVLYYILTGVYWQISKDVLTDVCRIVCK